MLKFRQVAILLILSGALWILATLYIHQFPGTFTDPRRGAVAFVTTFPFAWLSILLTRWAGRLSPEQLLAGVCVVGSSAMMLDGAVLHWAPQIYGSSETVLRFGAAWLLWGYGVSFAIALWMAFNSKQPANQKPQ